jgi:hypothetical protein
MPDMAVSVPVQGARNKPKLLDQVRDVIRRKHFSIRIASEPNKRTWIGFAGSFFSTISGTRVRWRKQN